MLLQSLQALPCSYLKRNLSSLFYNRPLFKKRVFKNKETLPNGKVMEVFKRNVGEHEVIYIKNGRYYYYSVYQFRVFPISKKKLMELGAL